MKRKCAAAFLFLAACAAVCPGGSPSVLENPALNPVKAEKTEIHAPVVLVKDGTPAFVVYAAEKSPRAARGAQVLREAFLHCTGKTVPLVKTEAEAEEASASGKAVFAIGNTSFARKLGLTPESFPAFGFAVRSFPRGIVIAGDAEHAGLPGVYDFIERYLGCRFYLPTAIGSLWPECRNLTVEPVSYRDEPYILCREAGWFLATAFGYDNKPRWEKYLGKDYQKPVEYGFPAEIGRPIPEPARMHEVYRTGNALRYRAGHGPSPAQILKAYPGEQAKRFFYQSPGGVLYAPVSIGGNGIPVLDVTNLELADLIVDEWAALLKTGKSRLWGDKQTQSCNADFVTFGQCDADVPLMDMKDHPVFKEVGSDYANLYGRFHKRLAERLKEKLPGTRLSLMAYAAYSQPPSDPRYRDWPDNVELQICPGNMPGMIRNDRIRKEWNERIAEWEKVLGHKVGSAWFYGVPINLFARAVAPEFTGEAIRRLNFGRTCLFFDFYGHFEWCYYYSAYAMFRCLWNPDFNVRAAIDEHWVPFYGPKAGPLLKEFHDLLVDSYLRYVVRTNDKAALYPVEILNRMSELLASAETSLDADSVEMKRFRVFAEPWKKAVYGQLARIHYKRTEYSVAGLGGERIELDGKLDEPIWKKTPVMDVCEPNGYPDKPSDGLAIRMLWAEDGVYVSFRMQYVPVIQEKRDIWGNDDLEVFLAPGAEILDYYHFAVDPKNEQWYGSRKVAPIGAPYMTRPPSFRSAVFLGENFWSAELFIPYKALQIERAGAGDVWYGNFVRTRWLPEKEFHGSSMTVGDNHNYIQYGKLIFVPPASEH